MNIRLRKDLNHSSRKQGLETVWILKDPVSFSHFQFSETEYFLANLFNGQRSVEEVAEAWRQKFKSVSLSLDQVNSFAQRLIGDQLVVVPKTGYGRLLGRFKSQAQTGAKQWLSNPLAIRFRGINPEPLLKNLDWLGRIMFHPAAIVLSLVTAGLVLLFLLGNFELIAERTPRIEQILSTRGVVGLLVTVAIVKLLHEIGHALACRRFGADCLEIGVMLLALIPTLYCNVSDAWTISQRWKRMMVSFAGMYVEICLAAIAAIFWCFTPPGLLSALLFNVIILCSLNTVLVNGNPLLRYDGYYLLSDWLEKPNLSRAATSELNRFISRMFRHPSSQHKNGRNFNPWLLFYAIAALCYRWFVVGVIIYGLVCFASIWQARSIGLVGAAALVLMMFAAARRPSTNHWSVLAMAGSLRWARLGIATGLLALVALIPLPKTVTGGFEVRLKDPIPIYAPIDGNLTSVVKPYQRVAQGETVATLKNPGLSQKVELKRLELARARNELELLNARINDGLSVASKISVAEKNVETVQAAYAIYEKELKATNIVAPQDGIVFPVARTISHGPGNEHVAGQGKLTSANELMDSTNSNCYVESSQHLLTIAQPNVREILMLVDEKNMNYVALGQSVRLVLDRFPRRSFQGRVEEIYVDQANILGDNDGELEPLKRFPVLLAIEEFPQEAVAGSIGRAKISVPSQSISKRLWLLFERAMNTKL